MMDWVKFGKMKAEFEKGAAEIRERAEFVQKDSIEAGFAALLDGDTYGRDLSCEKAAAVPQITQDAILELWFRIGEKHGIGRGEALGVMPPDLKKLAEARMAS
ncbi:MAG: hypothetical protein ACR2RF_32220 [Geminicoccaceae bacterium]